MDEHGRTYYKKMAEKIMPAITKRRMEASFSETAAKAKDEVLAMIPAGSKVYRCGSQSLVEMGFWDAVKARDDVEVIDPYVAPTMEENVARRMKGMTADIMICSTNAITMDGKLVNLDGSGNRVAAMCYGPKKVIIVTGMNKVSPDLDTAMARVKHHASVINNIRLNFKNPCVEKGYCLDCNTPSRICNMWSIIEGHMAQNRIHVKLVGEDLGY